MINKFYRKKLVFALAILLIIGTFLPGINGEFSRINTPETLIKNQETSPLTFYTFDNTGSKELKADLTSDIVEEITYKLENLKNQMVNAPLSENTKLLKIDFVETLDTYGLIPDSMSKDDVLKLLNPSWFNLLNKKTNAYFKDAFVKIIKSSFISPFLRYDILSSSSGWNILCNIGSSGIGIPLPLFMLPRPRGIALWFASSGITYTSSLVSSKNFMAYGKQLGLAAGFVGIGLTGSFYGTNGYIFIGYATYTMMQAEMIEYFTPPNQIPEITNENPVDSAIDTPLSLSELSFRISDADGDRMSYTVTTTPNIGTGSGSLKKDGVYKIPISGLENNRGYSWTVEVSDGKDTTVKEFNFYTKMLPFNPFDEGWQYRKKITINHDQVADELTDFPVLISRVDPDLKSKAQSDGDDILFMDGVDVANRLYHEIEFFEDLSGELVVWVKIPNLSNSEDTEFYMYYGNPSCSSQQNPEKLWNTPYEAVWHLNNNPVDSIFDSTTNDNDGTTYGSMSSLNLVEGKTGKCLKFDGVNDYVDVPDSSSLCPIDITVSGWYKPLNYGNGGFVISKGSYDHWSNADGHTYGFLISSDNFLKASFERDDSQQYDVAGNFSTSLNQWYYLTLTYDETANIGTLYINGMLEGSVGPCHSTVLWYNYPWDFIIGASRQSTGGTEIPNFFQNCAVDEIHVLNTVKTSGWIATEYSNQNNPFSFLSFGPEETSP